jgi:hypothetical protein
MLLPSSQISLKISAILNGTNDWDEWLEVLKSVAPTTDVWGYVNLNLTHEQIPVLRKPLEPRPINVRPAAAALVPSVAGATAAALVFVHFSDLTECEKEVYHCLILYYET